jgi:nitric oxide reductase subunit B
MGALTAVTPWRHFTIDEYIRWFIIHSFAEGFWPAIVHPLDPPRHSRHGVSEMAVVAAGIDATLDTATDMIETAHPLGRAVSGCTSVR